MKSKDQKKNRSGNKEKEFEKALFYALKANGYLFPATLDDVEKFEELYGNTEIDMPEDLQSYEDLVKRKGEDGNLPSLNLEIAAFTSEPISSASFLNIEQSNRERSFKPGRIDYYKRILLAAEIVYQLHKEPTLGHLKLQKLIYLSQEVNSMHLPVNFTKQAAGPYDPQMARSLDKKLKEKKWFKYQRGKYLKYMPLEKAGEHLEDFKKFFPTELEGIHVLIETFSKATSAQVELVATIYACWKEIIKNKESFSVNLVTQRVYEWSEQKKKFSSEKIESAIKWMNEKGLYPIA